MKYQARSFLLFFFLIMALFFNSGILFQNAYSWTPLEGHIEDDAILKLSDSPYRIVKDVIVDQGVELIIEPGVVIQIADGFSLIVNGSLYAAGTIENYIEFTSSRLEPDPGLWGTILFIGDSKESMIMKYAVISHAKDGITINSVDGEVLIEDCKIMSNSRNGVKIVGESKASFLRNNIINNSIGIISEVNPPQKGVVTEIGGFTIDGNTISYNREYGIYFNITNLHTIKDVFITNNKVISNIKNGIHITSNSQISNLWISNNEVSFSGSNGIYMSSFSIHDLTISGNDLSSNRANGIYLISPRHPRIIANISRIEISDNSVDSNIQNGILILSRGYFNDSKINFNMVQLNGVDGINLISEKWLYGLTISDNTASGNNKNGISLSGSHFSSFTYDANIFFNLIVGNNVGLSISGNLNTNVTSNSVSFNTIGLLFSTDGENIAYGNDIYSNTLGANVTLGAVVTAEWNYWGDSTGPYHISLNPEGKGNPVNGNGVNLDFLPFLFTSSGGISNRPTARIEAQVTEVFRGELITIDASKSSGDNRISKYLFNFGDGKNSGWITSSRINHNYSNLGIYNVSVTVMDSNGLRSINLATVSISVVKEPSVMTIFMKTTPISILSGGEVSVTARVKEGTNELVNANVTFTSDRGGIFSTKSGLTDVNGEFETKFNAPKVNRQTTITLTAWVSKAGFYNTSEFNFVIVSGATGTLMVQLSSSPSRIQPGEKSLISIKVTDGVNPINEVDVSLKTFDQGTLTPLSGKTNSTGVITAIYTAPTSITPSVFGVKANATKSGYFDGSGEVEVMVLPSTTTTTTSTTTRTTSRTTVASDQTSTYLLIGIVIAPVAVILGWIILNRRSSDSKSEYKIERETSGIGAGIINKITDIIRRIRK